MKSLQEKCFAGNVMGWSQHPNPSLLESFELLQGARMANPGKRGAGSLLGCSSTHLCSREFHNSAGMSMEAFSIRMWRNLGTFSKLLLPQLQSMEMKIPWTLSPSILRGANSSFPVKSEETIPTKATPCPESCGMWEFLCSHLPQVQIWESPLRFSQLWP